jgi:hypothetical protein
MVPIDLTVQLSLNIIPSYGLVASGFPSSAYIGTYDGIGTTFTVQSAATTPPREYVLEATGTNYQRSQSLSHTAIVTINVTNPQAQPPARYPPPSPPPPQPSSQPNSSSVVRSGLSGAFTLLAATMTMPLLWSIVIAVVAATLVSLTALSIYIRRTHRKPNPS